MRGEGRGASKGQRDAPERIQDSESIVGMPLTLVEDQFTRPSPLAPRMAPYRFPPHKERPMPANTESSPIWFITACSTGLGRALAEAVLKHGHRAVVTARNPAQIQDIVAGYPQTSLAAQLDVANFSQVKLAITAAEKAFGRIDVLVNNAGYGYLAAVEEGEEQKFRDMFETNFFCLATLIRRVLPGMRAC